MWAAAAFALCAGAAVGTDAPGEPSPAFGAYGSAFGAGGAIELSCSGASRLAAAKASPAGPGAVEL